ncbi:MAG: GspH/FimT family pseudopilin [bacterium]
MAERRSPRGYSLIEVVLLMAVMAVVVAVGQPMLGSSLRHAALWASVEETVTAIQFAQSNAVNRGEDHRVTFDEDLDKVTLTRSSADSAQAASIRNGGLAQLGKSSVESTTYGPVPHPVKRGAAYILDFRKEARFRGADITDVAFGTKTQLTYDSRGVPEDGGTVRLSLGGRGVILTIDAVTGRVTLEETTGMEIVVE